MLSRRKGKNVKRLMMLLTAAIIAAFVVVPVFAQDVPPDPASEASGDQLSYLASHQLPTSVVQQAFESVHALQNGDGGTASGDGWSLPFTHNLLEAMKAYWIGIKSHNVLDLGDPSIQDIVVDGFHLLVRPPDSQTGFQYLGPGLK